MAASWESQNLLGGSRRIGEGIVDALEEMLGQLAPVGEEVGVTGMVAPLEAGNGEIWGHRTRA